MASVRMLIWSLLALTCSGQNTSLSIWDKRKLLLEGGTHPYDADAPPPNMVPGSPLGVQIGLSIRHVDFNIITGMLSLKVWFRMRWLDNRLLYFGNDMFGSMFQASSQYIPVATTDNMDEYLWTPDLHVIESSDFHSGLQEAPAFVYAVESSGLNDVPAWNVYLSQQGQFQSYCNERELVDFPFDIQKCTLTFESWSHDRTTMQLFPLSGQNFITVGSEAVSSHEYALLRNGPQDGTSSSVEAGSVGGGDVYYRTANASFNTVALTLELARFPTYYLLNAIMPMIMLLVLSEFTFWIPVNADYSGSGERLAYSMTCLLTIVAVIIFTTSNRPMISQSTWLDKFQARCVALVFIPIAETASVFWLEGLYSDIGTVNDLSRQTLDTVVNEGQDDIQDAEWELVNAVQEREVENSRAQLNLIVKLYEMSQGRLLISPRSIDVFFQHFYPMLCFASMWDMWQRVPELTEEQYLDFWAISHGYGTILFVACFLMCVGILNALWSCLQRCGDEEPRSKLVSWRYSRSRWGPMLYSASHQQARGGVGNVENGGDVSRWSGDPCAQGSEARWRGNEARALIPQ